MMPTLILRFLTDDRGSAAIEYSILLAGVAVGVIAASSALGQSLGEIYQTVIDGIASVAGQPAP